MPQFLFVYHGGGKPQTQAEIDASMAAWGKWMSDHADSWVDPGNPVGKSSTVSAAGVADNGGANPTTGYTIVSCPDLEAACAIAAENPLIAEGGSVEVAEIVPVQF